MPDFMRKFMSYAGAAAVTLALGVLLYWVTIGWLRREFARAALELTQDQAEQAAGEMARALPTAAEQNSLDLRGGPELHQSVVEVMRLYPNIILTLITNGSGIMIDDGFGQNSVGRDLQRHFLVQLGVVGVESLMNPL